MAIVVEIMAKTVPNQLWELACYILGGTNIFLHRTFMFKKKKKSFLPFVMHPAIVSGIEIARKNPFGTESSLFSNNMMQFLLEQVIE